MKIKSVVNNIFFVAAACFLNMAAFGCSISVSQNPHFDPEQYVFIGEVIGVETIEYESNKFKGNAVGLKIKVSENIYSPTITPIYRVFPLRLIPSCGLWSDDKQILADFPIGSEVRVIAKKLTTLKNSSDSEVTRLETSIYNRGSITRNDLSEPLHTYAALLFDYRSYIGRQHQTASDYAFSAADYNLLEFELRKDLIRLESAKSETDKMSVLERLIFHPFVDLPAIVKTYLKNDKKIAALTEQWQEWKRQLLTPK